MKIDDPTAPRELAADYVLGTMGEAARRHFERLVRDDARFCRAVTWWEERFFPLLGAPDPAAPPEHVLEALERRIAGETA